MPETAITPTRAQDYPEWYQQVIVAADLAENSPVRGCMVIKPWGYGIWESIQRDLDRRIKETGHENAYFPLFIPLSYLQKEATHVAGFAKECAVVTHHRLEVKEGKLVPTGELEEPLIVRPTSEMIIGESFSRWVESYRDLPLLINQWANVVRWEMRPRIFLRTTEFLWQEGHTVHATAEEAQAETLKMLEVYRACVEDVLAIPVILGEKSPVERFPGADATYTLEMMMQDGKALQGGTSHNLGQNFAEGCNIRFSNKEGQTQYAYTTSWGITTRLIGGLIMVHADDDGMRLPPKIAPKHIVILPVIPKLEMEASILEACHTLATQLRQMSFGDRTLVVQVDTRDKRGGEKNWEWIKKGVPLRLEVGPRDLEARQVTLYRRDKGHKERHTLSFDQIGQIPAILEEMQQGYFESARAARDARIHTHITRFQELEAFAATDEGGFVLAKWSGEAGTEERLDPLKMSIRCLPLKQTGTEGACLFTGKPAKTDILIARSY